MVEINLVGLGVAVGLVVAAVALHFSKGTGWEPTADIASDVLDRRAESLPETDFPEPMNRSIGGGAVGGAVPSSESDAELEEGETDEDTWSPADIPEDEVEYFEVEFAKEGETIELANNESILDQGEEHGWDLPYACRQGQCVSCAGQVTDGGNAEDYVVHDDQEMLDDGELDDGYTLTCVAYPKADFTIETGEAP